jgi:hypothetical protein
VLFDCTWKLKKPENPCGRKPKNVYPLVKRYEIESETTITIHSNMPDPSALGVADMPDPMYVRMTNMSDLTNNKQRG